MRLTDADALGEKLETLMEKYAAMGKQNVAQDYNFVMTVLACAPTVDAVEVVRCKDCAWYENGKDYVPYCDNPCSELQHPNDETFCSYGEGRSDGHGKT